MSKIIDITDKLKGRRRPRLRRRTNPRRVPEQEPYVDRRVFGPMGGGVPTLPPEWFVSSGQAALDTKLIEQAQQDLQAYDKDPLKFVKQELKIPVTPWRHDHPPRSWKPRPYRPWPLWSMQREILRALVKHRKVAVKSCHGSGKTYVAAIAALYLLYVKQALGLTTAPTFRQVKRLLWGEIRNIYNQAHQRGGNLGGKLLQTSLELDDKWYMEGFSTDQPEVNLTGFHADTVFVIVDEAGGVDSATYDMLETVLTSESSYVLLIGNPIDPRSEFAECFRPGSEYKTFSIPVSATPNVRHGKMIWPALVSPSWPEKMKKKWGKDSPLYKSRVRAEFPSDTVDGLIPMRDVQGALDRELPADKVLAFGVDVARQGSDRTVIGVRWASGRFRIVFTGQKMRDTEVAHQVRKFYNEYKPSVINVDDIGVGGGVVDILYDWDLPVNGIVVSEEADESPDELDTLQFHNKRAQYYWRLMRAFEEGQVDIDDDELANELTYITATYGLKIKVLDKDKIKVRLKHSPDLADCMMLAWSMDEQDAEREVLRFL